MYKFTFLIGLLAASAFSQVTNKGLPHSWKTQSVNTPGLITMPAVNTAALLAEDALKGVNKAAPVRFAYEFSTGFTLQNSGAWTTLPAGDRIWQARFVSAGAKAIHFWFKDFYIPPGATLYVYNNAHTDVLGAYTEAQNSSGNYFGTWPVSGDDVWLEYYEPQQYAGQGKFTICKIGHAYKALRGMTKSTEETLSGDCNYDVECFVPGIENRKDITKHSVTRIIGSLSEGAFLASGALINTTANNGVPYVLSANHAWVEGSMYTFRFNWINPTPSCPSPSGGDDSINQVQTLSGATLRARREESDFMLLEINSDIPSDWGVIWSGWNRSSFPPPYTYGVHHPGGDIMKVCMDEDAPQVGGNPNVWDVISWNLGVTEGGSSGSPLLDNNGRIIGQLWYGGSGCNGSESNGAGDSYGRLNVSWNAGSTPATRLHDWLDPLNTGAFFVDAYPAQQIYVTDAKTVLLDLGHDGCSEAIHPQIRLINYGSAVLTSAQINYSLNGEGTQTISWTGSLPENQAEIIDLPELNGTIGNNVYMVWVASPNGIADNNPVNNSAEASFTVSQVVYAEEVTLTLVTDGYASEISWELKNQYGNILYSMPENSYENNLTYSQTLSLESNGCYTFTIFDGYGDGICCSFGEGSYSLVTDSGITVAQGGQYGHKESTSFRIQAPLGNAADTLQSIKVFPNPSNGAYTITLDNDIQAVYTVYNVLGQQVTAGPIARQNTTFNISHVAGGLYLLVVTDKATGAATNFKLVKE